MTDLDPPPILRQVYTAANKWEWTNLSHCNIEIPKQIYPDLSQLIIVSVRTPFLIIQLLDYENLYFITDVRVTYVMTNKNLNKRISANVNVPTFTTLQTRNFLISRNVREASY